MILPKKKDIFKINKDDPVYYNYYPLIGYVYRKRLLNTLSLLKEKYNRLLEVGYGSGILFPALSRISREIYGLEIHQKEELVYRFLRSQKIDNVILKSGSVLQMPFPDNFFDCIISVSTLEHIAKLDKDRSLDKTFSEIKRVLEPEGDMALSFPVKNILTDSFYKIVGYNPRLIHPSSHSDIINTARRYFKIEKIVKFPNFPNINFSLYCSILCKNN